MLGIQPVAEQASVRDVTWLDVQIGRPNIVAVNAIWIAYGNTIVCDHKSKILENVKS